MSEKKINWSRPNFLRSKENSSLIVVSVPSSTDDKEFFRGVIISCENSASGNAPLQMSHHYRKAKFEICEDKEILIKTKVI